MEEKVKCCGGCVASNNAKSVVLERKLLIVSGVLVAAGFILSWTLPTAIQFLPWIYGGAIISGGWCIFPKALSAARRFLPDINLLMTVAVTGAVLIGEWSEAAVVTFLFALSEFLEDWSERRARRAIQSLLELSPQTALVRRNNTIQEIPATEVVVDDLVIVKSGMGIPLDGVVLAGESTVNQAPITGESVPVEKKLGDTVFAGTINGNGSLEVCVTKPHTDTMLARMIHLVKEAQEQRAPSQRFVDVFSKYYTPSVMAIAFLVLLIPPLFFGGEWKEWIYRACVLLVIACPCALVISTPVSIVSGLTGLARRGVLIKGGTYLETIGKLKALAVDKTGTITEGKPHVLDVIPLNNYSQTELIRVAASIDSHSQHPLAEAIVRYAKEQKVNLVQSQNYLERTGRGAEAIIDGHHYFVGNHRFTHELAVCSEEIERKLAEIEEQARSVVVVGHMPHSDCKGEVLGVLAVGDKVRENAAQAIRRLHHIGVREVVMLSGDNQRTANAIARQVGIDEVKGDLLPDQKIEEVRALTKEHRYVGMIGDGVNDAPAMAAASVGIAMGVAGTDTAIETADIALMKDDLGKVAETVEIGRRTLRIIQFNIVFSLGIKGVFLILAVMGRTSLWLAIAADTGATLLVIANALRLLRKVRDLRHCLYSS
jgi:Zn2+/Cd2+-exporting ATPase